METTYDITVTGTISADSEEEARALVHRRLSFGPQGIGEPVVLDLSDIELTEVPS